jgi:ankyrin repeat protein
MYTFRVATLVPLLFSSTLSFTTSVHGMELKKKTSEEYLSLNWHLLDATRKNNIQEALALLDAGADINFYNVYGKTPLMIAAYRGHSLMVFSLLGRNANLKLCDYAGRTCLHYAAQRKSGNILRMLLIAAKEIIDVKDIYGDTALACAINGKFISCAKMLLEFGANPFIGSQPPICKAALNGDTESVFELISAYDRIIETSENDTQKAVAILTKINHLNNARQLVQQEGLKETAISKRSGLLFLVPYLERQLEKINSLNSALATLHQ